MESFESTLVSCPVDDLSNLSSPVDTSTQGEISIGDGRIEASGTEGTIVAIGVAVGAAIGIAAGCCIAAHNLTKD